MRAPNYFHRHAQPKSFARDSHYLHVKRARHARIARYECIRARVALIKLSAERVPQFRGPRADDIASLAAQRPHTCGLHVANFVSVCIMYMYMEIVKINPPNKEKRC